MSLILDKINYVYSEGTAYQIQALKDVNLEIRDGQFIGVIGHTGSGKSTLIQHLNGLVKATSGTIYFNGQDIYDEDFDLRELRNRVGLVFQYPEHQLFETTIFDDVCFGPKNQGLSKEEAGLRAFEALRSVGLPEELYYQSPFDLSGGQKRRVAIAGVLAMKPEVLILDEPTAGLDPAGRDEILDLIARMHKEKGITVILVSHSMEDVAKYVERIIVMNHGQVMFDNTPCEVFKHYKELEEVGLAAPQVTYIMHDLKARGADVDVDADISSVVSFKGLTHFGIGFGWYMYLVGNADIASYAIGILVGLFFVFAVWFLYKKAYQLQQVNRSEETDQLVGRECTIYFKQSDNKYTVQTNRDGAMREVDVISETGKAYQTGDRTIISSYKDGTLYIK